MKLITISGLDGCGKTTQLDLIEKELQKNHKVKRFHMIGFSIANKLIKQKKEARTSKIKAKTNATWGAILMRKIAIVIDVFRFRLYYLVKSSEHKTDYLIIDRYFYDQIINIKYLDKQNDWKNKPFWQNFIENHLIQPNLKIYLKITPEKILERNAKIEQGKQYLLEKNGLYNHFSKKWKLITIDGSGKEKEIQQKIKKQLNV